jgi:CheY-like chemotaxis protein
MARILIVDDEHNVRSMIRLALEHVGHQVGSASDGPEGLEKFGDGSGWELVLLDQRMPGLEGVEVLRQMRARDVAAKVVMITAFGTIDLAVEAMKAGATDFLRKPFTTETLRRAVEAGLAAESSVPSHPTEPPYSRITYNGFRIQPAPPLGEPADRQRHAFTLHTPSGEASGCQVVLSDSVTGLVETLGLENGAAGANRLWQAFAEQMLANYLWQRSEAPPGGILTVTELTSDLHRWVQAAVASASYANRAQR